VDSFKRTRKRRKHESLNLTGPAGETSLESGEDMASPNSESVHQYRNYEDGERHDKVAAFYKQQHNNMTYDLVLEQHRKHLKFDKVKMSIWECISYLDRLVDDSDPDTDASQTQHALQSAEASRKKFRDLDWLHLTCLIHDCGKLLAVDDPQRGLHAAPQWLVVGDTFPVGARFDETNVLYEHFAVNPDSSHPVYSTKNGIYKENCGLDNVTMSWGHDEYLYQVLTHHPECTLPAEALAIVRYHSFYPWHKNGGDMHLTNEHDERMLEWVKVFNEFDLYSKKDESQDVEGLMPYYKGLIDKYIPGELQW